MWNTYSTSTFVHLAFVHAYSEPLFPTSGNASLGVFFFSRKGLSQEVILGCLGSHTFLWELICHENQICETPIMLLCACS